MKSQRNVSNVHQQNILDSLQHRIEAARAQGDSNLVAQLEREMQQSRGMATAPLPKTTTPRASNADVSKQHRQNLRDNVQRRLISARDRGDQTLIHQLERELQELA